MKSYLLKLLVLLIGIIVFDYLFYMQAPGLNALIWIPVMFGMIRLSGKKIELDKSRLLSITGLTIAGTAITLYGSALGFLAYLGSFFLFLGLQLEIGIKTPIPALIQAGFNFITAPFSLLSETSSISKPGKTFRWIWRFLKLIVIPLIILIIFITLFRYANPVFNRIFLHLDVLFSRFFDWILSFLEIGHFVFLCFTSVLMIGILYKGRHRFGLNIENGRVDALERTRRTWKGSGIFAKRMTSLKDEYRMGLILLFAMNLVMIVVNISEVIWLRQEYSTYSAARMSDQVHEGTSLLIISILLSILVLLILFRRNLNFYPKNRSLILGALAWMVQNGILGLSVIVQNWMYISQYGLTYKRIGVYFFLALVIIGLFLLYTKIRGKKSGWYLVRTNSWSFYLFFLLLAIINWDSLIIQYNLRENAPKVDVYYLLDLPERNIGQLERARPLLLKNAPGHEEEVSSILDKKINRFKKVETDVKWTSYSIVRRKSFHILTDQQ